MANRKRKHGSPTTKILSTHQDTWQIMEIEMYEDYNEKPSVM